MPELCNLITDMYGFYTTRRQERHALPASTSTIRARRGRTYERPTFSAVEE
jgi:hypothetical protein